MAVSVLRWCPYLGTGLVANLLDLLQLLLGRLLCVLLGLLIAAGLLFMALASGHSLVIHVAAYVGASMRFPPSILRLYPF